MIVRVVLSIIFLPILGYGQMMDDLREPRRSVGDTIPRTQIHAGRELLGVYYQNSVTIGGGPTGP